MLGLIRCFKQRRFKKIEQVCMINEIHKLHSWCLGHVKQSTSVLVGLQQIIFVASGREGSKDKRICFQPGHPFSQMPSLASSRTALSLAKASFPRDSIKLQGQTSSIEACPVQRLRLVKGCQRHEKKLPSWRHKSDVLGSSLVKRNQGIGQVGVTRGQVMSSECTWYLCI